MSEFEEKLKSMVESSILKMAKAGQFFRVEYSDRSKLPPEFIADVWAMVDFEKVKKQMANRIEEELANRIVNSMAAEMATDVKQILSVQERREALRAVARENMERICGGLAKESVK